MGRRDRQLDVLAWKKMLIPARNSMDTGQHRHCSTFAGRAWQKSPGRCGSVGVDSGVVDVCVSGSTAVETCI